MSSVPGPVTYPDSFETIELKRERTVATITLNRPDKMNSINDQLLYDTQHALELLERDQEIRALVITGSGRAFCSGFDISPRKEPFTTVEHWREHIILGNETCFKIWRSRLPVIAAVNGFCLGGGCDIAMACDLTLAADNAEFGEPEIQFQASPPFAIMPWVMHMKHAKELLLTGGRVGAQDAARMGLANKVVPADELMAEARKLAVQLSKVPPVAMMFNKKIINRAYEVQGFFEHIDYGAEMFTMIKMSEPSEEQKQFFQIAREQGLKAAFKWRDQQFALEADA